MLAITACALLISCASASQAPAAPGTTGEPFVRPASLILSPSDVEADGVQLAGNSYVDVTHASEGYVTASSKSDSKQKLKVTANGTSTMYYDLPEDGTPITVPLSMGDGSYELAIWESVGGARYFELASTTTDVRMEDEFQPYIRPNVFCEYDATSDVVTLANEITAGAGNEGDAVEAVYEWVTENIAYDDARAEELAGSSGYIPDPDATIASKKGICFDYSSLVAAMLRSQGIPCKIVTGNVGPDDIYHAWNMIYIDGTWVSAQINIKSGTWEKLDTTFAAGGNESWATGEMDYTDRYVY